MSSADPTFEELAAEAEQDAIQKQVEANSVSFIEHQTRAWSEIQKWWVEAQDFGSPPETANGPGSTVDATASIRAWLPQIFEHYNIETLLDAPCGDWNWLQLVHLGGVQYTGWDADQNVIDQARTRLADMTHQPDAIFERVNILTVPEVPSYDLILCRDFLAHLPNGLISDVLNKFKESGSRYLLASNYHAATSNDFVYRPQDYTYFGYAERPANLELSPFGLTKVEAEAEEPGPGGVISQPHELALFELNP